MILTNMVWGNKEKKNMFLITMFNRSHLKHGISKEHRILMHKNKTDTNQAH